MRLNTPHLLRFNVICLLAVLGFASRAKSQSFSSGSTGAYGPMNITALTILNVPPDGVFHCTTINVSGGGFLLFNRNALNTPVYLLATGDVTINGTISLTSLDGGGGTTTSGGRAGPGGFDGGPPAQAGQPAGDGFGPGAGRAGDTSAGTGGAGGAGFGTTGTSASTNKGSTYGTPLLVPLIGGSGGGGQSGGIGGGGGGGAILVASTTRIVLNGGIQASGADSGGPGSGGAIRLVAPTITGSGGLIAHGGSSSSGNGRIRIDTLGAPPSFSIPSSIPSSVGRFMVVFPTPAPRLDIVEAAGTIIPEGTNGPVQILLPYNSDTNRTVTLQARNFNAIVPVDLVLTPETGGRRVYSLFITNTGVDNPAQLTANVVVPVNTLVTINAWTR